MAEKKTYVWGQGMGEMIKADAAEILMDIQLSPEPSQEMKSMATLIGRVATVIDFLEKRLGKLESSQGQINVTRD